MDAGPQRTDNPSGNERSAMFSGQDLWCQLIAIARSAPRDRGRRRRLLAIVGAGIFSIVSAITAVAIGLATSSVIYACVDPTTRVMTLSSQSGTCPNNGSKIHWN